MTGTGRDLERGQERETMIDTGRETITETGTPGTGGVATETGTGGTQIETGDIIGVVDTDQVSAIVCVVGVTGWFFTLCTLSEKKKFFLFSKDAKNDDFNQFFT